MALVAGSRNPDLSGKLIITLFETGNQTKNQKLLIAEFISFHLTSVAKDRLPVLRHRDDKQIDWRRAAEPPWFAKP